MASISSKTLNAPSYLSDFIQNKQDKTSQETGLFKNDYGMAQAKHAQSKNTDNQHTKNEIDINNISELAPFSSSATSASSQHLASKPSTYNPPSTETGSKPSVAKYYSADGSGNNLQSPDLGSADSDLSRLTYPAYGDNQGGISGSDRPGPREISNAVLEQEGNTPNNKNASDLFWQWGQFIDHDLTLVEHEGGIEQPIPVPNGDPSFDPFGQGNVELPFTSSETSDGKEQVNSITSFLDGSMIYGSDQETLDKLRSFEDGKMLISDQGLLPSDEQGMFMAGDERVNEQPGLTSMHTLWLREHNQQADKISEKHPNWSEEKVFQKSRQFVTAEIQHITYNEFLPLLVGKESIGEYQGYDPSVDPSISNEFATAAFRFGHSMLSPQLLRLDENGQEIPQGHLSLADAFNNQEGLAETGIDPIIRGQANQVARQLDPMIIDDVRNTLFGPPGSGGMDLGALNIQRGRDHGLPSYNDTRSALGLEPIDSFDDPIFQSGFGSKLASVYDSVYDVDLWVGGLAENAKGSGMVGETFNNILVDQFERLRSGDRLWHENTLNARDSAEVLNTSLADVIERNSNVSLNDDTALTAPETQIDPWAESWKYS